MLVYDIGFGIRILAGGGTPEGQRKNSILHQARITPVQGHALCYPEKLKRSTNDKEEEGCQELTEDPEGRTQGSQDHIKTEEERNQHSAGEGLSVRNTTLRRIRGDGREGIDDCISMSGQPETT